MLSAVGAEFLGVSDEPIGVDDRRIVFVTIIAIEPSEDDADVVFVRRLEFLASPCRQIDICGKGLLQEMNSPKANAVARIFMEALQPI
jgi:hypothetical protein